MNVTQRVLWAYIWYSVGLFAMAVLSILGGVVSLGIGSALLIGALLGALCLSGAMVGLDKLARRKDEVNRETSNQSTSP